MERSGQELIGNLGMVKYPAWVTSLRRECRIMCAQNRGLGTLTLSRQGNEEGSATEQAPGQMKWENLESQEKRVYRI